MPGEKALVGHASNNEAADQMAAKGRSRSQDDSAAWEDRQSYFREKAGVEKMPEQQKKEW